MSVATSSFDTMTTVCRSRAMARGLHVVVFAVHQSDCSDKEDAVVGILI